MKTALLSAIVILSWVGGYNEPNQYQVNHETQFPAANQFYIDDFNRTQRNTRGIVIPGAYSYDPAWVISEEPRIDF